MGLAAAVASHSCVLTVLVMQTDLRVRVIYAIALVLFGFIGVMAFKAARQRELDAQMNRLNGRPGIEQGAGRPAAVTRTPLHVKEESETLV